MPYCKNDPKKTYKGNEPSPKGLGYCAHCENIGRIKNGKDGIVVKNYNKVVDIYVAFYPNQIKSIDNEGGFDINNDNIFK